jgi:hypothetical protein
LIYPYWSGFQTPLLLFVMPRPDRHGETSQLMHLWVLPFNLEDANEGLLTTGDMTCESQFCMVDTVDWLGFLTRVQPVLRPAKGRTAAAGP